MTDTPAYTVSHNAAEHRFEVPLDGQLAVAEYRMPSRSVMRLTHTEVPQALEGRGIAGALARAAMAHAREHQLKIDAQCPYMRAYMDKHPETHDLRA
ncbi:N-acetyltransferase [Rhizobacter sp. J219]|uniref:GNAT family N-acetyltransferase n=1 Tax=Rhizobacter sp. J219 TaxID=2898430 RepID=UPI002150AE2F|nr:GNAT family N-acetyltransferase [Rhizobacter sp. J219]MCR5883139.1 N-acetyltransferase [Rhizobacter sp. J219]